MEKSRIITQMEILEKLLTGRNSFKTKEDEVLHYRNVTSKILNLLEGCDHIYRDIIVKTPSQIDALISALHANMDSQVLYTIIKILNELVGRSNAQKRAQIMVHHGATKALLQCIYLESKENTPCDDYLFLLHQVLYRIGVKDKKIGVRARLSQCLPVVVNLLRAQVNLVPHNRSGATNISISPNLSKTIMVLLNIARLYSQNLINASRLGRNGLIGVLLKIISYSGKNNVSLLKLTLETLNFCVRTKSNGARAVNHGAMAMLLQLFLDWNRMDSRDKQVALRRCVLNVVKNLINLRAGRKAFLEADGLHTFYGFCEACRHQISVESIVTLASLILRKCFPKNRLPLSHYDSTLRCPLPSTGAKERSKYLLELRKGITSPTAPRSTSPIDVFPLIPFLGCQGDNDFLSQRKQIIRDQSPESVEFHTDFDSEDTLYIDATKERNRIRARNLFRTMDRKLLELNRKSASQQSHQNYLGRHLSNSNSIQPAQIPSSSTPRDSDMYFGLDQDVFDDKDDKYEQEEQCLVDRILMNGSGYQPSDDRLFEKLKDSYEKFLGEMEIFKNERRKSSADGQEDSSEKGGKNSENNRLNGDNKKKSYKDRETVQPSMVSLQMKPFMSDRKLCRNTIIKNEAAVPRTVEVGEERNLSLSCAAIGLQRSGLSLSQPAGLYQRSKRSFNSTKSEAINIRSLIYDLTGNYEKLPINPKKVVIDSGCVSHTKEEFMETYMRISSAVTRSLGRFSMIGYPDLWEQSSMMNDPEPLTETFIQNQNTSSPDSSEKVSNNSKRGRTNSLPQTTKKQASKSNNVNKTSNPQRPLSASSNVDSLAQNKILDDLRRIIDSEDLIEKVVYDLDEIVTESFATYNLDGSNHSNSDELELDKLTPLISPHLKFDSQFESGNLRKVIQIRQYEYDLILSPDVNTNHHTQWFYFRVSGMESGVQYRFNIINCEKPNSQFNFGMQPLLFSVKEAVQNRGFWKRWGSEIFYYKNHFARSAATCGGNTGKSYFTCTFLIEFPNAGDICYLAYHYPYTYTRLLTDIEMWTRQIKSLKKEELIDAEGDAKEKSHSIEFQSEADDGILFTVQELCTTILKNPVPLITITNWPRENGDFQVNSKQYVFLSSRVHPGESNASWVIKGCIDFLISDNPIASKLRDLYIFKIVPMLNPDGVINGCHRCSMAGQDLNRRWLEPCEILNPTIYNTKGLMMLLTKLGQAPLVYCDFHGHSRRKNVFMFGCSSLMSWISDDTNNPTYVDQRTEDQSYYTLPNVLNKIAQQFSIDCCSFSVDKAKESTARVVVWRQFGVKRSYTMESSYCSCDQGAFKHLHINVPMLEEMGARFAEGLLHIDDTTSVPIVRTVSFPSTNLSTSMSEKNLSFKFDQSFTHSMESRRQYIGAGEKSQVDSEFSGQKCATNEDDEEVEEDEEEEVSDNDEDDAEEGFDKDNGYNDEYNVEDSD